MEREGLSESWVPSLISLSRLLLLLLTSWTAARTDWKYNNRLLTACWVSSWSCSRCSQTSHRTQTSSPSEALGYSFYIDFSCPCPNPGCRTEASPHPLELEVGRVAGTPQVQGKKVNPPGALASPQRTQIPPKRQGETPSCDWSPRTVLCGGKSILSCSSWQDKHHARRLGCPPQCVAGTPHTPERARTLTPLLAASKIQLPASAGTCFPFSPVK